MAAPPSSHRKESATREQAPPTRALARLAGRCAIILGFCNNRAQTVEGDYWAMNHRSLCMLLLYLDFAVLLQHGAED